MLHVIIILLKTRWLNLKEAPKSLPLYLKVKTLIQILGHLNQQATQKIQSKALSCKAFHPILQIGMGRMIQKTL
jgi:hypothetical protein